MTLPICAICAKTSVLCSACESKLQKGKISELDVELSKILYELGGEEIGFDRAIDAENFVVIITQKKDIGKIIGKSGANIRMLSNKLGKQVRVISRGDLKDTIYDFVAPARIIGINTVFKADGSTIQRVRINKKDKGKLRMSIDEIRKIISSLSDDEIEIAFE